MSEFPHLPLTISHERFKWAQQSMPSELIFQIIIARRVLPTKLKDPLLDRILFPLTHSQRQQVYHKKKKELLILYNPNSTTISNYSSLLYCQTYMNMMPLRSPTSPPKYPFFDPLIHKKKSINVGHSGVQEEWLYIRRIENLAIHPKIQMNGITARRKVRVYSPSGKIVSNLCLVLALTFFTLYIYLVF